jgi:predicted RND superfamily exporter protein
MEKVKDRESNFTIGFLLFVIFFFIAVLCMSLNVHAEEAEPTNDYSVEERVNFLEIRLEELGYQINEMQTAIEAIETANQAEEENRLALSDKLDLVIIALNNLIENDLALLQKQDDADLLTTEYRETVTTALATNETAVKDLNNNTVSGNSLISDFNTSVEENMQLVSESTLKELNKTLLTTNTFLSYLFVLVLIVLVLVIVYGLGALLNKLLHRHVV